MEPLEQVEQILITKGIDYRKTGDRIRALCMNKAHDDHDPSMFIFPDGGVFCFGCGFRSDITQLFKVEIDQPIGESLKFSTKLNGQYKFQKDLPDYPNPNLPVVNKSYFGLSKDILIKADARKDEDGILFPIYFYSKMIGWQKRFFKNDKYKYISSPRIAKRHFTNYFYPVDLIIGEPKIILVEGALDALTFIDQGFPALCNFGLHFNETKLNLLKSLLINTVILAFDCDSGLMFELDLYNKLKDVFITKILPAGDFKNPRENLLRSKDYNNTVRKELR